MIGYLHGEILENSDGKILLAIGDRKTTGAVGYSVAIPQTATYSGFLPGQKIELFIYTHVREEAFDLYGFTSKLEKTLFLTLLAVNGIGPRSALGILSSVEPANLIEAITHGDQAFLTRIPGIGKKTAERVVVELRDLIKKKITSGILVSDSKGSKKSSDTGSQSDEPGYDTQSEFVHDAKEALLTLGYKENDIQVLFRRILEQGKYQPQRAEDLIKKALQQLA